MSNDDIILEHYRRQAAEHQLQPSSAMLDETTRELEVNAILACLSAALGTTDGTGCLLEVGCGNGYLLSLIRDQYPGLELTATDYSPDMVELAESRRLPQCRVQREDARSLTFASSSFDVVVGERCLINILDATEQEQALTELHRVVKPGGHVILIEAFLDGAANLNRARTELGLAENSVPYHNRWFDKENFLSVLDGRFEILAQDGAGTVPPTNFLSTHYFVSRVIYPTMTRREVLYNTEFVKFFRFAPPHGNFSPIQLFFLKKLDD